jgi:hypothetical protein
MSALPALPWMKVATRAKDPDSRPYEMKVRKQSLQQRI